MLILPQVKSFVNSFCSVFSKKAYKHKKRTNSKENRTKLKGGQPWSMNNRSRSPPTLLFDRTKQIEGGGLCHNT